MGTTVYPYAWDLIKLHDILTAYLKWERGGSVISLFYSQKYKLLVGLFINVGYINKRSELKLLENNVFHLYHNEGTSLLQSVEATNTSRGNGQSVLKSDSGL